MEIELTAEEIDRLRKASEEISEIFKKYSLQGLAFVINSEKKVSSLVSAVEESQCDAVSETIGHNLIKMHDLGVNGQLPELMTNATLSLMIGIEFYKYVLMKRDNLDAIAKNSGVGKFDLN